MMLFKPYHMELIKEGIKTQTRRLWKKQRCKVGSIHLAKIKLFTKEYFAKIEILNVRKEHLLSISEADANAEGGYTRREFLDVWDEINDVPSGTNPEVFVVKFRVIEVE